MWRVLITRPPKHADFCLLYIAWNKGLAFQTLDTSWMWGYRRIQKTQQYHTKNTLNNTCENYHRRLDIEYTTDFQQVLSYCTPLRSGLLPAISARVHFRAAFMNKSSSQQNCNLPVLLRLCQLGSTMMSQCITSILHRHCPVGRYNAWNSF